MAESNPHDILQAADVERMVQRSHREELAIQRGFFRIVNGEKVANLTAQRRARKEAIERLPKRVRTKRIYWPGWMQTEESQTRPYLLDVDNIPRDKFYREVGPGSELAKILEDKGYREPDAPYNVGDTP